MRACMHSWVRFGTHTSRNEFCVHACIHACVLDRTPARMRSACMNVFVMCHGTHTNRNEPVHTCIHACDLERSQARTLERERAERLECTRCCACVYARMREDQQGGQPPIDHAKQHAGRVLGSQPPSGTLECPSPPVHARRLRWALSHSLPRGLANHAVTGVPPTQ